MRTEKDPQYTLVLGGGAHLGAIQAGQLLALCDAEIDVRRIIACSVGALNGAHIARGLQRENAEALVETWKEASNYDIFDRGWRRMTNLVTKKPGISRNEVLRELAKKAAPATRLENFPIPTEIVTCNLTTGGPNYHQNGDAVEIIVASCSMPGIYPPVEIEGEHHVDGGVLDVLPWRRAGGEPTIVLDCKVGRPTTPSISGAEGALGVLLTSFTLSRHHRVYDGIDTAEHIKICPGPQTRSGLTLKHGESLAQEAYEITKRWISEGGLQHQTRRKWSLRRNRSIAR